MNDKATFGRFCPKPLEREFYEHLVDELPSTRFHPLTTLDALAGYACVLDAGSLLRLTLLEGPQIVNLFGFNADDPDERIWHQSIISEGLFLTRYARIWGTMARYRPLLTLVEDTVSLQAGDGAFAQHHPIFGGSGTPADWRFAGGDPGVKTTWEQFAELMTERGISPHLITQNVCLFQKSYLEPFTQRLEIVPSDAVAGDRVTLFAEIDMCVLLAVSPYIDGSRDASTPGVPQPRRVEVGGSAVIAEPLPWPYQGLAYPDLGLYLDADGVRSDEPVATPGL
jgi:uncharacterized protein YcgI (DUF1989 family)